MTPVSFQWNKTHGVFLLLLIFTGLCYLYVFDKKLALSGDNVTYYLLGRSMASGNGYAEAWTIENNPHTQYPPGYPAVIALTSFFSPGSEFDKINLIKVFNGIFFFCTVVMLFFLFTRLGVRKRFYPLLFLPLVTNPHLLRFATIMMSEIPFLFFSVSALYAVTRIDFSVQPYRDKMFYTAVLCVIASMYIRTQGIALLFGIGFYFAEKRKYRYLLSMVVVCLIFMLPWVIRVQMQGGSSYLQQLMMVDPYNQDAGSMGFDQLLKRIFQNANQYISLEIPIGCFPAFEKIIVSIRIIGWVFGIALIALSVNGIRRIKAYRTLVIGYFIGTFGILLLWPSIWSGVRFIICVLPLLWCLIVVGISDPVYRWLEKRQLYHRTLPLLVSLLFLVHLPPLYRLHQNARLPYPPPWQHYFRMARWIRDNTPPKTITSCRKSGFFYLFSGRPTCVYLFSEDNAKVIVDMVKRGVDFIVVDQLGFSTTPKYLIPAIFQNKDFFENVLQLRNPDTFLFKIKSEYDPDKKSDVAGVVLLVMALRRYQMKDYVEAKRLIRTAMKITRETVGTQSKVYANAINDLGIIAVTDKDYSGARRLFEQSHAIEQGLLGNDHPEIARSLINIAEMYKGEERYEKADSLFQKALSIQGKVYGAESIHLSQSLYILLRFYTKWGKPDKEEMVFNRMMAIVETVTKKEYTDALTLLTKLQKHYKDSGDEDKVEDLSGRISAIRAEM